jgi:hypothetical protein
MGMFDTVTCLANLPDVALGPQPVFQTYSLGRGMCQYAISEDGRLLRRLFEFDKTANAGVGKEDPSQSIELPAVDLEFHGDLLLYCCSERPSEGSSEYVARFTHGTLEWFRPLSAVSEIQERWLRSTGDR